MRDGEYKRSQGDNTERVAALWPLWGIFTHTPRRQPSAAERRFRPFVLSDEERRAVDPQRPLALFGMAGHGPVRGSALPAVRRRCKLATANEDLEMAADKHDPRPDDFAHGERPG
jgi:hypothetical protein